MNLDFGRCQVYKLNISACLTERELDYYNLFCDGITRKELKKRLGVDYPTSEMLSEEFHISLEDAADLLKAQMNKKCFRKFLTDEIEKFSPNEVREIRKSAIYVADEEGNLTDRIKDNKKIVWFGNECVRRCNVDLKDIPLLDQFLLLKCGSKALTGVLNQIVERGVNLDGKHYLFYTSTTGQMKETEITLVEEEYWKENEYALMCGLTEERINSKGGINMGKYFAAKALNLSNSIKYDSGISIDEVIIVPDFKTFVSGMVNYLDVNTLDIQEKKMEIEIEHMDGAGIFIPGTFPCSCQIRGGWLKGAVFPFDFHKFIEKYRDKVSAANMIDAWGNPVTVEEFLNAKMILTDSQLKMRKYYDSILWNCYGDILYDNLCKNVDSDITPKVKRNVYQKSVDREKEILESRDRIKKEQEEIVKVLITKTVYDDLMGIKVRKGCEKDRYILYILYVLIRRFQAKYGEEKEYIRIYKGLRQKSKITAATIDNWIDSKCTQKGLDRLEKNKYIRREHMQNYDKVYLRELPETDVSDIVFDAESNNPLLDLWEYNGERKVAKCEICNKKFVVVGNTKTCSDKCSKVLVKRNKNKTS